MQTSDLHSAEKRHSGWKKVTLRWVLAFFIPFMITFGLLVSHEKNKAYDDLQRGRPISGQVVGKPADTIEAWEMAAGFTACLSTPVGLLGLVGYGGFLLCAKLARPSKKGQ